MTGETHDPDAPQNYPDLSHLACLQIQDLVTGNGLQKNQVRVSEQTQNILQLSGLLKIKLQPTVSTETASGRFSSGIEVASENDFQLALQKNIEESLSNPQIQSKIVNILNETADQGWAFDGEEIKLPENQKVYFYSDTCHNCDGKKSITCSSCHGDGLIPCGKCLGDGNIVCVHCEGLGDTLMPDGSQQPCRRCKQRGMVLCPNCRGRLNLTCIQCKGTKQLPCTSCHQTGVITVLKKIDYTANTEFILDLSEIEGELKKALQEVDTAKILSEHHAKLINVKRFDDQNEKVLKSIYTVEIPVSTAVFSLNGQAYPAFIWGQNALISRINPFLDHLIKPGIAALQKISKGPMASGALIQQAGKFTLIKTVLNHINSHSKKHIFTQIKKDYPVGLSDKYAKACISFAHKAVQKLTEKPRYIGCAVGLGISGILMGGWFFGGLQKQILAKIAPQYHNASDFILLGFCWLITFFAIKFLAAQKIKKLMPQQMLDKGHLPAAGNLSYVALILLVIILALCLFFAPIQSQWFVQVLSKIK